MCVCVVIRAEFIFQEYEIIIHTYYVNSVKRTELHMSRGLKYKGKEKNYIEWIIGKMAIKQIHFVS